MAIGPFTTQQMKTDKTYELPFQMKLSPLEMQHLQRQQKKYEKLSKPNPSNKPFQIEVTNINEKKTWYFL